MTCAHFVVLVAMPGPLHLGGEASQLGLVNNYFELKNSRDVYVYKRNVYVRPDGKVHAYVTCTPYLHGQIWLKKLSWKNYRAE